MNELKFYGLIEIKRQGLGKPNKIYPLDFGTNGGKLAVRGAGYSHSGMRNNGNFGCDFFASNNKEDNNIYYSQSDSVNKEAEEGVRSQFKISPKLMEFMKKVQEEKAQEEKAREEKAREENG